MHTPATPRPRIFRSSRSRTRKSTSRPAIIFPETPLSALSSRREHASSLQSADVAVEAGNGDEAVHTVSKRRPSSTLDRVDESSAMATPQRPHPRERWMTPPGAKSPGQSVAAVDAEEYEQQHYTPRRRRQSRSAAPAPPSASSAFPTSMVRGRSRRRRRYLFRALPGGVAVPDGGEPATLAFSALPYTAATKSRQSARYAHMWRFKVVSAPGEDKCEGVAVFRIDEQSLYWAPVPEGAAAFSAVPSLRGYSSEWVDDADTLSYELVDDCALVVVVDIGKLAGVGDAYLTLLHFQLITQAGIFVLQAHTLDDKRAFLSTLRLIRQEIDWLLPPAHDQQSSSGLEHDFEPVDFSRVWQDLVAFQERMIQAEERFIELQHGIDSRLEAIAECADNINSLAVDEQELLATVRGHYISSEADFTTRLTQHARNADSAAAQVHGFGQRVKDVAQQVETYKCEANELLDGNSRTGRRSAPSKIIHTMIGAGVVLAAIVAVNPWGLVVY